MINASSLLALKYIIDRKRNGNRWYSCFYITKQRYSGIQALRTGQNGRKRRYKNQETPNNNNFIELYYGCVSFVTPKKNHRNCTSSECVSSQKTSYFYLFLKVLGVAQELSFCPLHHIVAPRTYYTLHSPRRSQVVDFKWVSK